MDCDVVLKVDVALKFVVVLELDCELPLIVVDCDLPVIVVPEMDCDVLLNVLLLHLVVVLEIDCDVILNVLLLHLVVALDVLLLPLDGDHDTASYAAAEHYEWSPQLTMLPLAGAWTCRHG